MQIRVEAPYQKPLTELAKANKRKVTNEANAAIHAHLEKQGKLPKGKKP